MKVVPCMSCNQLVWQIGYQRWSIGKRVKHQRNSKIWRFRTLISQHHLLSPSVDAAVNNTFRRKWSRRWFQSYLCWKERQLKTMVPTWSLRLKSDKAKAIKEIHQSSSQRQCEERIWRIFQKEWTNQSSKICLMYEGRVEKQFHLLIVIGVNACLCNK